MGRSKKSWKCKLREISYRQKRLCHLFNCFQSSWKEVCQILCAHTDCRKH